ncbi:serine/threonine-protein kinase Chk1 [Ascobolus immersus RN42]|uniref:non-specific serine/threonine protein kinase n=1 Tax=Ascobolus immersus RN42 TaxID=1160509 RepID=A0A3N4IH32_ASCIM|nr:serine/threonine-protein kinase Chk1 [Ascobolus immersus RN42]
MPSPVDAVQSQPEPLPKDLPFQIVSETIGRGAYASIKKAKEAGNPTIFAVKFIHKPSALALGKITGKQLNFEVALHKHCSGHQNVVKFLGSSENETWRWIAMEFAEGGDLFDKIEPDVGVPEDIAHFYFTQLIAGVSFLHSKGVAHRDIKPENMLLDSDGNLKIADFGLASLFSLKGQYKYSTTLCGSPPYVAPEVTGRHYRSDISDIWSCGVVLFVLLAGNTPWDEPTRESYEFSVYLENDGRVNTDLWANLPMQALSLLRGMMKISPNDRFSLDDIRRHPWFTRPNPYLSSTGQLTSTLSLNLATRLMENLHVSFGTRTPDVPEDIMPSTQPDFALPHSPANNPNLVSYYATQPAPRTDYAELLADEPSMTQFAPTKGLGLSQSLTQNAQRFKDICPPTSLTEFFTAANLRTIQTTLTQAFHVIGVRVPEKFSGSEEDGWFLHVKTKDGRRCPLEGDILLEPVVKGVQKVRFWKGRGDPMEWRRLFKRIAVGCKDIVITNK